MNDNKSYSTDLSQNKKSFNEYTKQLTKTVE
jgi:hypothetical protein